MITFLEELVFHMNTKTTLTEEDKLIFRYLFLNKLSPGNEYKTINLLLFNNGDIGKKIMYWAYNIFLRLLYDYSSNFDYGSILTGETEIVDYRDIVKSESFTNLLISLKNLDKASAIVLTSQISIDFSSLTQILGGSFLSHNGSGLNEFWTSDFVACLPAFTAPPFPV